MRGGACLQGYILLMKLTALWKVCHADLTASWEGKVTRRKEVERLKCRGEAGVSVVAA